MASRGDLERRLDALAGFADPIVGLEQYPTPPDVAAYLLHVAAMRGDLSGTVVDLGTGTGVLALGAASLGAPRVVGIERDPDALAVARENEARIEHASDLSWLRVDVRSLPLCPDGATVVMNPPFGAQDGARHADRAFLRAAGEIGGISYSIHNAGSRGFVESFAADHGGHVTHAYAVELDLDRQFDFHNNDTETIDAEAFRIEW